MILGAILASRCATIMLSVTLPVHPEFELGPIIGTCMAGYTRVIYDTSQREVHGGSMRTHGSRRVGV